MTTRYLREPNERFLTKVTEFEDSDDRPVVFPLAEFKEALRKKMRGVRFANNWSGRSTDVYYPHEKFTRGVISIRDDSFVVMSRTIENARYSTNHPEHRIQQSKNLNTAVKKAAAALTPWSVDELAVVHGDLYTTGRKELIQSVGQKATIELGNLGLQRDSIVLPMLRGMSESIPNVHVRNSVEDFFKYDKELNDLNGIGESPTFVYVGQDHHGQQHLDTLYLETIGYSYARTDRPPVRHYERSPHEGYDELVGKISVLNMATVGDYVSGVGMKVDEDMFYVC
tara:strand:+ start:40 stop:888 length:849 start_codon:yes stop_codon:yes gene_type:complete